ncbi:flagellar hook-basal body complex protein FliE [Pseudoroseomonas deserti]|uniref:Flagellar hook-basal body complex protein FliE n=1 Tax=Teichococcus deserti TaxID=1817963 RepID=A0A1V2H416_9PROT|nr:flagellar hook-basal body complex protein FliE [Pseudoroseomonas deserti]ONG54450.1 flagellar hook-basal body complex protein FliE [Pseudoroseomonas deserti]
MSTTPLNGSAAFNAYRAAAQIGSGSESSSSTGATAGLGGVGGAGGSFGAMLERAVNNVVDTTRAADTASTGAINGTVGVTDVVLAVSRAELALQTTVALRDRVVAAYQEVMRMPL